MKEILSEWIINLTVFSLISSMTEKMLPGKSYTPYIQIFCGILMILTLLAPIISLFGAQETVEEIFSMEMYEMDWEQLEQEWKDFEKEQEEKRNQIWNGGTN